MSLLQLVLTVVAAAIAVKCLKAIPERGNVVFCDEDYVAHANLSVRRNSRHSDYYVNVHGEVKKAWGNNVTVHAIFNQYLHNEYKRSFVEIKWNFCDLLKNPLFGYVFISNGITSCPAPPKVYHLWNGTVPLKDFPFVLPFEKCRLDMMFISSEKVFCKVEIFVRIEDNKSSKIG